MYGKMVRARYALRVMWPERYSLGTIPKHYALIAGYVSLGKPTTKYVESSCLKKQYVEVKRDWYSNGWELGKTDGNTWQGRPYTKPKEGGPDRQIQSFPTTGTTWIGSNFDPSHGV
jgi:hypothetical protein